MSQGGKQEPPDMIIAMTMTLDGAGNVILVINYSEESVLRLFSIPDFTPQGVIQMVSSA
jgi:hypothetical protein